MSLRRVPQALPLIASLAVLLPTSCGSSPSPTAPAPQAPVSDDASLLPPPPPRQVGDQVFVGAGDIGNCNLDGARETAALLDHIQGTVFTLGDNAYSTGSDQDFADCYDPHWGRQKYRTWPSPGNHDYETAGAAPYFAYFGDRAGSPGEGYYYVALGAWDVYSLNSNIPAAEGSPQYAWLDAQLSMNRSRCSLAYWHHAIRSSAKHGGSPELLPLWRLLYRHGVDLAVVGHDHIYERFAPMNADLMYDPNGMREIVAGTGGGSLYDFKTIQPLSEVRIKAWGVLKLTLRSDSYSWDFLTVRGDDGDSGEEACH